MGTDTGGGEASDDKSEVRKNPRKNRDGWGPIKGETSIPRGRWREREGDGEIIGLRGQGSKQQQ